MLSWCRGDEDKQKHEKRGEGLQPDAEWHSMDVWKQRKQLWSELKEWNVLDEEQKTLAERALLAMEKAERTEKKGKMKN
jgi:hypothetical protein